MSGDPTPAFRSAGVILAGGGARRLGGGDKGLLPLAGRPMLAHVVGRLKPQVEELALNANGDPERFAAFGLPVIPDPAENFAGPLAGVLAGLRWAAAHGCERVATAATDTPFLPPRLVAELAQAAGAGERIAVARSGGRSHPVFALWPVAVAAALEAFLRSGRKARVLDFIATQDHGYVDFEPYPTPHGGIDPFLNVNTPDELRAADRLAGEIAA